ncbi:MAG TPA: polyprenyl synthetase family protein [Chloroflexia bacterium]|nr:polyprenyl synthetase family protein [Chloroflexia bacterium]
MEPAVASGGPANLTREEWSAFEEALRHRRDLVYDYLNTWPGADAFRPPEIHDALFSYIARRGKALRPLLLLLSCAAVGGDEWEAVPAAAAVEVFQTWTLVHDDIIDRDRTRRGKPTVHAQYEERASRDLAMDHREAAHYGITVGILAGDLQQSWCYALLSDLLDRGVEPSIVLELVRRMATFLTPQLLEGEMLDVQFSIPGAPSPGEEAILDMLSKKTAALLEYAAWCGAKIGLRGGDDEDGYADALGNFARLCGTAFQLHDDILGLTADEALLGKPVGSDLREGKLTYLVSCALAKGDDFQRSIIRGVLGAQNTSQGFIEMAIKVIHDTGAIYDTQSLANSYIEQGLQQLEKLPATPQRELLRAWALYLLARKH